MFVTLDIIKYELLIKPIIIMSRFCVITTLLVASLSFVNTCFAEQYDDFQFKHLNYEQGLPSNWVTSIIQDADDFMWFGTSEGLTRFDGYGYKHFDHSKNDSTLSNDGFISSLAEDTYRNCIWIITPYGVSRLDKGNYQFKHYPISGTKKSAFSPFYRGTVCVDVDNNVWVEGFSEAYAEGLFIYDSENDRFINKSEEDERIPERLTLIFEDRNKHLWFGSQKGLYSYNSTTGDFTEVPIRIEGVDSLYVTCVAEGKDNQLFIGTHHDHSIYVLKNGGIELFYELDSDCQDFNWISSLTVYDGTTLMASVKDLGVLAVNIGTLKADILQPDMYKPNGINSTNPFTIYKDRSGSVWIGNYNTGIDFLDKNRKRFQHYQFNYLSTGLLSNNVRAFFQDSDDDIWVGTKHGGGISRFDPATGLFENYKADKQKPHWLDNDIVISIGELEKGKLLVGTYGGGVYLFDKNKKQFSSCVIPCVDGAKTSEKYIYSIYKDRDSKIWIGSNTGIVIYDNVSKQFTHHHDRKFVRCFLDTGDDVLIGTWTNGLCIYNKNTATFSTYPFDFPNATSTSNIQINDMEQDHIGNVWLATNKGLIKYSKHEKDALLTMEDGLPEDYICALQLDNRNNVWASTKAGIIKYSQDLNDVSIYNKFDGLQSNVFEQFVSLKTKDGAMAFAGSNGFNYFYPDSILDNLHIPEVHLSDMKVLNEYVEIASANSPLEEHISLTDQVVLSNDQSSFSFEYVAVNYSAPEKSIYSYILEGYDKVWQIGDEKRVASYTQVPAGHYTFKVKATNNDGISSTRTASVDIVVKPPFFNSPIAYIIYFLLLIAFLVVYQMIVRHNALQKDRIEEELKEIERLQELSTKRVRFFTNISHELRTPLTLIATPLARLVNYSTSDKQLVSLFQIMDRNAQRLSRIVNQLMDFRRAEEDRIPLRVTKIDIIEKVQDILACFNELVNNRSIKIKFKTNSPDGHVTWLDVDILDKVLFNLLSNAAKFSEVNGEIEVQAQVTNDTFIINVVDHGCGIPADDLDKIFERFYTTDHADHNVSGAGVGLSFTKSLVLLHKGNIAVSSEYGKGSCFTVTFPIDDSVYTIDERKVTEDEVVIDDVLPIEDFTPSEEHKPQEVHHDALILIAEDFDDLRAYLAHNLSSYEVISASNGKEALRLANERIPDLIISDVMMPEMDGLELCKHIKTNVVTSHIPVIILSSRTSAEQKLEGFVNHADAYIEKPFSIDLLSIQVANILQLKRNISAKYMNSIVEESTDNGLLPLDKAFLDRAMQTIEQNLQDSHFSVESLSAELGMSRSQLFRKFKSLTNSTPSQFVKVARLKKAAELLSGHVHNVNEVAFMVGFADSSHFIASFKKFYGQTPKQFAHKVDE